MQEILGKYLNPITDFGFKKLFGTEANKDLLIDFLNAMLQGKEHIKDLTYQQTERLGIHYEDRRAIFDLYCENDRGEKFIIELQRTKQQFFKERTIYYSTFPIYEQAKRGSNKKIPKEWDFNLKAVYLVAILDFIFDETKDSTKYRHEVKLSDIETGKVFYDKLTFIYLELPKFTKTQNQLETLMDKWIYAIKFMSKLENRPKILKEKIFKKLFDISEVLNFNRHERIAYEESVKAYRDLQNSLDTAVADAVAETRKKAEERIRQAEEKAEQERLEKEQERLEKEQERLGRKKAEEKAEQERIGKKQAEEKLQETIRNMKKKNFDTKLIASITGLEEEEVEKI